MIANRVRSLDCGTKPHPYDAGHPAEMNFSGKIFTISEVAMRGLTMRTLTKHLATPVCRLAFAGTIAICGAAIAQPERALAQAPKAVPKSQPQAPAAPAAAAPPVATPPAAAPPLAASAAAPNCPGNPNALGISRTVEIDTTGGAAFGSPMFRTHDFLREGEVVLTFDDGPWPKNTPNVLAALAHHCVKAIFFPIGTHTTYNPGLLKQVAAAGHSIGSHTWCHQNLAKTKGKCQFKGKTEAVDYDPKAEIEKGFSAVRWAVDGPTAPFFRFPALSQPPELITYLGQRNIAIFSADIDSLDFKLHKPEQVRQSVMNNLKKQGKGILLLHDFQKGTALGISGLLDDLKAGGYKVVFMRPKDPVKTLPAYDEMVKKLLTPAGLGDSRPTSSVVKDVTN